MAAVVERLDVAAVLDAARLLSAFERLLQELIAYNCEKYCAVTGRPRALQSKWSIVGNLRQGSAEGETLGRRYLPEKDYVRIASRNLDMPDAVEPLTAREQMVLRLLLEGKSNGEIAQSMRVSVSTIKHQVSSIFGKYGVSSRAELIVKAKAYGEEG